MRKTITLVFILILAATSLIMVKSVSAQSISKPSAPEFTIKLVDNSYDIPPTTKATTNFYTNKTTTTTIPGYHVQNLTIELTIKNQPSPATIGGNRTFLIYNIQTKPHFAEDDWTTASSASIFPSEVPTDGSGFTVASFRAYYSGGDQIDFRVQALLEYEHTVYEFTRLLSPGSDFGYYPVGNATDIYETSEWSPTQTFIMPNTSNPTHILFSLDTLLTITMVISIVALLVAVISVLLYRKHRRINKIGDRENC